MNPAIQAGFEFLLKLLTLGVIPKGWQTKVMSGLGIVAGLGMLAGSAIEAISTGQIPTTLNFQEVFGLLFVAGGGTAAGLGRKVDVMAARLEQIAAAVQAAIPNPPAPPKQ